MKNNGKFIGLVIKSTGSFYTVHNEENGAKIECTARGKLRLAGSKATNPIVVGDKVEVEFNPDTQSGVIENILPRKNYIIRRSSNLSHEAHIIAANLNVAILVVTIEHPRSSFEFIDRFLVTAEAYKVPAVIVVNKIDLYTDIDLKVELEYLKEVYTGAGYCVLEVSSVNGTNIQQVKDIVAGKISLIAGNSGVGKSTLINKLIPGLALRTGEISAYHNKGMHTTTFSEMVELPEGGYIIDTPGIKGFGLVDIEKEELYHFFPELFKEAANCRFSMCTHTHEPGCAVKQAVDEGRISESRYISYLKILEKDQDKYRK